jgi:hypothetical protein
MLRHVVYASLLHFGVETASNYHRISQRLSMMAHVTIFRD